MSRPNSKQNALAGQLADELLSRIDDLRCDWLSTFGSEKEQDAIVRKAVRIVSRKVQA